jgi:N-acetylmuramic acid 6-phosphate etherase
MPRLPQDRRRTEQRNLASRGLDRMGTEAVLRVINREDQKVASAVGREIPAIAKAVDAIVAAIRKGGRLIYVGAGTSGRLAILDASEVPPTYGVSREVVQGLIAGGRKAVTGAVEGAEDSVANGVRDLKAKKLSRKDVVVGIAASGTTPYVLSALAFARKLGATTIAVTANRNSPLAKHAKIAISVEVGPEVVTGSTRMKAGTSQKLVLNMLSTASMVRLGHVYDNLMIDLTLTNEKLLQRATRILAEASGAQVSAVEHALRQSKHDVRVALTMLRTGSDARSARARLALTNGNLRKALGE